MKRARVLLLCLACLGIQAPARATDHHSAYVVAEIPAGSEVRLACEHPPAERMPFTAVAAFSITNEEGPKAGRINSAAMGAWRDGSNKQGVSVGGYVADNIIGPRVLPPDDASLEATGIAAVRSTLRAAWASWNGERRCALTVDGAEVVPSDGTDAMDADYRPPTWFAGGVEAHAAGVAVATGSSYEHEARGYLFALFAPGAGSSRALGPEGQSFTSQQVAPPYIPVVIMTPTSGVWRYEMEAAVLAASPVLWTMTLPN